MAGPNNPYAAAAAALATTMRETTGPIAPVPGDVGAGDMGAVRVAPSAPMVPTDNPYLPAARALAAQPEVAAPELPAAPELSTPTTAPAPISAQPNVVSDVVVQQSAVSTAIAEDFLNSGVRPDVVAEIRRIAREEGVPLPLAAQSYMDAARARPGTAYRRLLQQNPGLRQVASQGSVYADFMADAAELATVENAFNTVRSTVVGAARFPTVSIPRGLAELNDVAARAIANTLRDVLPDSVIDPIDAAGEQLLQFQEELGIPLTPSEILRAPANVLDDIYTVLDTPAEARTFTTDVGGALGQFGAQAALYILSGGQTAVLSTFLASVDEQAQRVEQADAYGTIEGDIGIIGAAGVSALLDQLNLGIIFERVPEKLRTRLFRVLASGTAEGATEMLQAISSNLIAQQIYDPESGILDDAAYEGLLGGIVGAFAGALIPGRRGAPRPEDDELLPPEVVNLLSPEGMQTAADQAASAQESLEVTRAAIEETATFVRDPEAVRELLEAAGDQAVTIPVQEVERLYQEGALTDDDIAYLQIEDEITQQGQLSGDVRTTASRVLTLPGERFASVVEHVRVNPGAPTVAEARADMANREADIQRLEGVLEQARATAGEVNTLADTIFDQIRATRTLSRGQSRAAARLMAERYAARAALFEPGTTAQSLYERDLVAFEQEQPAAAAPTAAPAPVADPAIVAEITTAIGAAEAGGPVTLPITPEVTAALQALGVPVDPTGTISAEDAQTLTAALQASAVEAPPTFEQTATIRRGEETLEVLSEGRAPSTREVAAALENRQREQFGTIERGDYSAEAANRISDWAVEEVMFEVEQARANPARSAVGWYSEKFQRALDVFGGAFPELIGDLDLNLPGVAALGSQQAARDFFTALIAITSDGAKVADNFRFASRVMEQFRRDGRIDADITFGGERNKSMQINLRNIQEALDALGPDQMAEQLLKKDTISNLKRLAKEQGKSFSTAYKANMELPYAALVFGPKLGAFYANLMGDTGYLTMDRWWSRTFNRYRGTLLAAPTEAGMARVKELIVADRRLNVTPDQLSDDAALVYAADYVASYKAKDYKNGTELEKAANTVYKAAFDQLEDQPFNASDREFMVNTTLLMQDKLAALGVDLTVADIQAVLWYYEKRLYAELGARATADVSYEEIARQIIAGRADPAGDDAAGGSELSLDGPGTESGSREPAEDYAEQVEADRTLFQLGRGAGGYSGGGLAPLEGAPTVVGAAGPDAELVAVAEQYAAANGIDLRRQAEFVEVDPERAARIAQAYEEMVHAPQDPAVQAAYADLIQQTLAQYQALVDAGYTFTFFDSETDPYAGNPWNAMRDLRANKTMAVYGTYDGYGTEGLTAELIADNPMLQDTGLVWLDQNGVERPVTANDLFRAVHDAFGHGIEGAGFRARGEENAWQAHVRLFTGPAVAVLTSETRGQNSWLNYGPFGEQNRTASVEETVFAPQKAGIMPEFTWLEGRAADEPAAQPSPALEQPVQGPQTQNQGAVGAPRGSYTPPTTDDPRNLIRLTTTADASTFVHEVGHMFLFQMLRDLADPRLTEAGRTQLQGQIDATRAWFASNSEQAYTELQKLAKDASKRAARLADGPEKDAATLRATRLQGAVDRAKAGGGAVYMQRVAATFMDPAGQGYDEAAEVVFHEQWARGFEVYLGSGSAPSAELRTTFAKFAQYITKVYKSLRRLNVRVTPEITDVFDRLVATEDAIIEERRGSMYQISPGVLDGATPAEARELRRLAAEAETEARTQMAERVENSLKKEELAKRRARREQLANEIAEQVAAEPVYAATNIAKRGTLPDGTKTGTGKIDRAEFVAVADEATLARMPTGMVSGRVRPDNAIPLGDLATLSGFPDIYSMIEALTNPTPKAEADVVRERTDAAMRQEFGADFDPAVLRAKAVEVAQNDKFAQLQQLQLRILRRLAAEPMTRIARRQAEQLGGPAAAVDQAAVIAAQEEQARARTPQEGVQAALARIKADVQKTANASQRRAQVAARRQTAAIRLGMDPAAITEAAKRYVERLKVGDATPDRYRQAANRLTAKIERAIADRNYTEAATLMEQRALNLAVAKEAGAVQSRIEQRRRRWREVTARSDKRLAQNYSMDWVNAIRVSLEPFGLARNTPRNYDPMTALANLKSIEPTLFAEIELAMTGYASRAQVARQARPNDPYKDLTVTEINELLEQADRMLANARDSHGLLVGGRRVAFEAIADEVATNVSQRRKVQRDARRQEQGRGSRRLRETRRQLGAFKASLRRIEQWARDFDNGNPRGPLTRFLVRPVMAAVDAYTVARQGPQEAMAALLRGRTDLMRVKPIRATELDGYVFRTKGELIMALLHTGNPSNLRKLLLGGATDVVTNRRYVWGQEVDKELDTSRWDRFVDRMFAEGVLTKADMDLVQGIWDIFETTKQAAQAAHKQMYGYYFTEVVAEPVVTPVGIYPGGYAPAITDSMMNPDGDRFEAEEVMSQQSNAAMFPGAEKGFTQSRTEYNQPLDLDLTRVPAHFDRVMKFAYLGPAVRNAARLVTNKAFREAVRPGSPDVIDVAVIPWLQRTVQQRVTTAPTSRGWSGVSQVAAAVDRRVGLHIMAANLVNAAQQITGFPVAAARIPARHLAVAATRWRVNTQSARSYIMQQSPFMTERMTGGMNEASTTLETILREPGLLNNLQAASMRYGYFAQQLAQNLVDPTVWLAAERHGMEVVYPAAYAEALKRTGDEGAADAAARSEVVAYADSIVRDTQAPMQASDVSAIEASSPLARLFLKFYSYFNAMGNLLVTEVNIAQNTEMRWAGRYGRSFYAYLMIVTIPTVIAESIAQLARGGFDDLEDEDERDQLMFELLIGSQLKTMAAMVPFAGQIASTAYGIAVTDQVYDDRISLSAGIGVTESTLQNTIRLIAAAADPDTDIETRRAIRTTLDALGLILGLPTNWASKPISYAASVIEGESDPRGLFDIVQGVLTGKDGTDR